MSNGGREHWTGGKKGRAPQRCHGRVCVIELSLILNKKKKFN